MAQGRVDHPLVGAWRLRSFVVRASDGSVRHPFGEDVAGSLIYTDTGRFAAQVRRVDRPLFAAEDHLHGTPAEMVTAFAGFISYYGHYDYDPAARVVVHHIEGALFPNWEGRRHKRFVELDGERLRLTTPPTTWGGLAEIKAELTWERSG